MDFILNVMMCLWMFISILDCLTPEDEGATIHRNVGNCTPNGAVSHSSAVQLFEPHAWNILRFFFLPEFRPLEVVYIKIYRTIILPVVLYGCETWSLTLREERKLRVFENVVLRRIFGTRRDEVTGEWRRLHNEELNDLYSSPKILRMIKSSRMR